MSPIRFIRPKKAPHITLALWTFAACIFTLVCSMVSYPVLMAMQFS